MRILTAVASAAVLSALGRAEVVHLADGSSVAGAIERAATPERPLRILTLAGPREIAAAEIARVETRAELAAELGALAGAKDGNTDTALLHRCAFALRKGLFDEALDLAETALRRSAASGAAVALPPDLFDVPLYGTSAGTALDDRGVADLVRVAGSARPGRAMVAAARLERQARLQDIGAALVKGLAAPAPQSRRAALEALAAAPAEATLEPVIERMLFDGDASVRRAATEAARAYRNEGIIYPLVRALAQDDPKLRLAAMDAIELLNDPRAVGALIRNLRRASGGGVARASASFTQQTSVVSDFDVEIAQAAVIAKPIISVVQSGSVIDVGVAGVSERRVDPTEERGRIARLLALLTHESYGEDTEAWERWLEGRRAQGDSGERG